MDPDSTPLLEQVRQTIGLLEKIANDFSLLETLPAEERQQLHVAVAKIFEPDAVARRRRLKAAERERSQARLQKSTQVLEETGIRALRRQPVFTTPNVFPPVAAGEFSPQDRNEQDRQEQDRQDEEARLRDAGEELHCYVCKQKYTQVHHFYDQMCPTCAEFNYAKRNATVDLTGRVALLTGGRVKIGYQAGLKLLRAGAKLIVTTRFPRDSAKRYASEPDFADWADRLEIHGLDLRHTPSVEEFCRLMLATQDRLDFILNNACQTVRRPPDFYAHMMETERAALDGAPEQIQKLLGTATALATQLPVAAPGLTKSAELSQLALLDEEKENQTHLFPAGQLDQDLQQVDLRGRNSWRLLMAEVSTVELLEVQLINAIAPYVLNARLKPLMLRTPNRDKHIVNVSAVEGQFYRKWKTTRHPHTNMAKASLNMMTRTAATDYFEDGIHMNSVDTGWVTDEDPAEIAARKVVEQRFHPPLDIVDGAARIVDPIFAGLQTGEHMWGQFLKDYKPTDW